MCVILQLDLNTHIKFPWGIEFLTLFISYIFNIDITLRNNVLIFYQLDHFFNVFTVFYHWKKYKMKIIICPHAATR